MDGWRSPLLPLEKARSVPLMVFTKCGGYLFPIHLSGSSSTPPSPPPPPARLLSALLLLFLFPSSCSRRYLSSKRSRDQRCCKEFHRRRPRRDGDYDESSARNATSRSSWTLWILPCLISYFQVIVLDIKVFDLPRVLADDWARSPGPPIVIRHHFHKEM